MLLGNPLIQLFLCTNNSALSLTYIMIFKILNISYKLSFLSKRESEEFFKHCILCILCINKHLPSLYCLPHWYCDLLYLCFLLQLLGYYDTIYLPWLKNHHRDDLIILGYFNTYLLFPVHFVFVH